jgi:hypothetical protein
MGNRRSEGLGWGASMIAAGTFPKRHNTVLAEVLKILLTGKALDHGDGLDACSTMRLAHPIYSLKKDYDWDIVTGDRVVSCRDGRTQTIAVYSIPPACIKAVDQAQRESYIRSVNQARAELKSNGKANYDRK